MQTLVRLVTELIERRRGQPAQEPPDLLDRLIAAVDPETGLRTGGADPRRDGLALGP